jgi:hypothetical protein
VWLSAAVEHFRLVLRNGYVHRERADGELLEHAIRLIGPLSSDGLLAFVLDPSADVPSTQVQEELRAWPKAHARRQIGLSFRDADAARGIGKETVIDDEESNVRRPRTPALHIAYRLADPNATWSDPLSPSGANILLCAEGEPSSIEVRLTQASEGAVGAEQLFLASLPATFSAWQAACRDVTPYDDDAPADLAELP